MAGLLASSASSASATADAASDIDRGALLGSVVVSVPSISEMQSASAGEVSAADFTAVPLLRPAALLETVPGLIVTQHSGEGKANQYFLRAFNLDHGTDLATEIDGMPVNLRSHAHGQGYADLNFLIPETVSSLDYRKGPYFSDVGDFSTAGSVRLHLADRLPANIDAGLGEDGYRRLLATGSGSLGSAYLGVAAEAYHNDGPFEVPDDYLRHSLLVRATVGPKNDALSLTAMHYDGRWNSTDQISEHLIDSGVIDRYGSLAPTDGGVSHRDSLSLNLHRDHGSDVLDVGAYLIGYDLNLYSTFTDHLTDAVYGDQIRQHDDRIVWGGTVAFRHRGIFLGLPAAWMIGTDLRVDDIADVGIDHTFQRVRLQRIQDAAVTEASLSVYAEQSVYLAPKVVITSALRGDGVDFRVSDRMTDAQGRCTPITDPLGCNSGRRSGALLSPKFGIAAGPYGPWMFYLNAAEGFHSNDARGVTRDGSVTGVPSVSPLTRAQSVEIGTTARFGAVQVALDSYMLHLDSELVFNGDAGDTSPSGATTRRGVEARIDTPSVAGWHLIMNGAYSRGLFDHVTAPDDLGCAAATTAYPCAKLIAVMGREIPNAPTLILDGSLSREYRGLLTSLRARHFGRSPLVEDGSIYSKPYTTIDGLMALQHDAWRYSIEIFNLLNTRWNDITYAYVSRHPGEPNASLDEVVHPGVPRTLRVTVRRNF
jgi:hypothetical protein